MKTRALLAAAWMIAAAWTAGAQDARSAKPASHAAGELVPSFDHRQSAALFVGIRHFTYDPTLTAVRYAVDDAVDLADAMAIRLKVVAPERVVIALSGEPQKDDSKERLRRLIEEGAGVIPAGQSDILSALEKQGRLAGPGGLLIVSFATHGFTKTACITC